MEVNLDNFFNGSLNKKTKQLLFLCKKAGYSYISVGIQTKLVPNSMIYIYQSEAVYAYPENININGWPAIWKIVEKLNVHFGCGNGHTHQIKSKILIKGVYDLSTIKIYKNI